MFKNFKKSIKTQMMLIISVIMAGPLIVVVVCSNLMSASSGTKNINMYNDAQAQAIESDVATVLQMNVQSLIAFANAPSTIEFVDAMNNGRERDLPAGRRDEIMTQMQTMDTWLLDNNITVITGNQGMQLMRTSGDCVDIADREYYQQAMTGEIYVSNVQVSRSTGERITTFAVPIPSMDRTSTIGIVQRNYNLSDFQDLLAESVFEDQHELIIIDRNGDIVAHSGHEIDPENPESAADSRFYQTSLDGKTMSETYTAKADGQKWYISWVKEPYTGWIVVSRRNDSVAMHDVTMTLFVMLGIGIVGLIEGMYMSFRFARRIAMPIQSVSSSVEELTSGNLMSSFDQSSAERSDEVGQIANNSIALAEKLQDVIGRSKVMAGGLKKAGEELSGSSSQASAAASQVSDAVEEVNKGAISQAESVQDAVNEMEIIGNGVEEISDNTVELSDSSKNMERNCDETMEALKVLIAQSEKVSDSVNTIAGTISRTNDSANEISEFTDAINSIATQTNLLSLNASIEAARAGEAGKGFAVVADEISHLAAQSKESADKIQEITEKLQQDAASSVDVMNVLVANCDEQGNQLAATRERMDSMAEGISAVAVSAENISGRVTDLRTAKDSLSSIIEDLSAISEENAASAQQTNASMEELNATFNVISESAGALKTSAEELDEMIGYFKLDSDQLV